MLAHGESVQRRKGLACGRTLVVANRRRVTGRASLASLSLTPAAWRRCGVFSIRVVGQGIPRKPIEFGRRKLARMAISGLPGITRLPLACTDESNMRLCRLGLGAIGRACRFWGNISNYLKSPLSLEGEGEWVV